MSSTPAMKFLGPILAAFFTLFASGAHAQCTPGVGGCLPANSFRASPSTGPGFEGDRTIVQSDIQTALSGVFNVMPTGAPTTVTLQRILADSTVVRAWGYIGDGNSHPLSGVTAFGTTNTTGWTLGQWQAVLPSATSLSNEIDGEAIRSYIAAASGPVTLVLPPGSAKLSNPIASCAQSVAIFGSGLTQTVLNFTGGTDGWDHCTGAGTNTKIEAHDLSFNSTTLTGSLWAVQAKFVANRNVTFENVGFFNFNNCLNLTQAAGVQINYAWCVNGQAAGTAGIGNGLVINGTSTFVERIANMLVQNYFIGFDFISTNSSGQGIEDVAVVNGACGGVNTCISITAPNLAGYGPYKYSFTDMSVDATTQFINAPQERDLIVRGGDWLVDVPVGTWTGSTSDFIVVNKGSTARFEDMAISNNALTMTINSYIHVIGTNSPTDVQIVGNIFEYLNLTASAAQIVVDAAATAVVVKENIFTSGAVATAPPANAFSFAASDTQSNLRIGRIGQLIQGTGTGVALTSTVAKTVASVTLTYGEWDCQGYSQFLGAGQTAGPSFLALGQSVVNNNIGSVYDINALVNILAANVQPNQANSIVSHLTNYNASTAGASVFLVAQANFATGSETANNAVLTCRRWR